MQPSLLASVVIPTHNRPDVLRQALARLEHQRLSFTEYEVVVVDDGSTPPVSVPEPLRLVRTAGVERSAARNAGAAAARGEVLIFIDDDILAEADFVEAHLRAHAEWPDVVCTGRIVLPEGSGPFARFRRRLEAGGVPLERGTVPHRNLCAAGNMSIRRARFQELGGFDPEMTSGEDQDLALRHTASGGRLAFLPDAAAFHADRAMDVRGYCLRHERGAAATVSFLRRHPDWPENVERLRVNGPVRWGREPASLSLQKTAKLLFGARPACALLFAAAALLERAAPESSLLDRLYRLLLGVHLYRGFRRGLAASPLGLTPSPGFSQPLPSPPESAQADLAPTGF